MKLRGFRNLIGILSLVGWVHSGVAAAPNSITLVVPNAASSIEGEANNGFPFWPVGANPPSMRYQQVFGSSAFSGLGAGGGLITQIAFRGDSLAPSFIATIPSVQINLSTSAASPDGLSTTFANNVGPDNTVVYGPSALVVSNPVGPTSGPKPFTVIVPLVTPFVYKPGLGNLLMDFRTIGGSTDISLDAINQIGDAVGRQYSSVVNGNLNSATATTQSPSLGLVTQFTIVPIPEPGSKGLCAIGIGGLVACTRCRGRLIRR
jgi:hypothetical protein